MVDIDLFRQVVDDLDTGVYLLDSRRNVIYWNHGAEQISGFPAEEVLGRSCRDSVLIHVDGCGNQLCQEKCPVASTLRNGEACGANIFLHHKGGYRIPVSVNVTPIRTDSGKVVGAVQTFVDDSFARALQHKIQNLENLALIDSLTGVGNRRLIESDLKVQMGNYLRNQIPFGVLFIDIDHFKDFNDTYGHAAGDAILKMVASTLLHNIRSFESVGRWGGEEFVVFAVNVDRRQIKQVAEKLRALIESSLLEIDGNDLKVTVSIGATTVTAGDTEETLLARADHLMYKSKAGGRNCVSLG